MNRLVKEVLYCFGRRRISNVLQLKQSRAKEREKAIREGQMADPNQPTSLNQAITPVGTCTSICPEFERVERIVQKMVDKSEKVLTTKPWGKA